MTRRERIAVIVVLFAACFVGGLLIARHYSRPTLNAASGPTIALAVYGIGPIRAAAIVAERDANGPFTSWDDFRRRMRDKDIGDVLVSNTRRAMRLGATH